MNGYPPLPEITNPDMVLAVFAHESLGPLGDDTEFSGSKRLAQLGKRVVDQAITFHYFMKEPFLSADDIEEQRRVNAPNYVELLHSYGLKGKIRCSPEYSAFIDTQEGALDFFEKYMGAVFLLHGMSTIQEWVSQIVEPGSQTPLVPSNQPNAQPNLGSNLPPGFGNMQQQHPPPPPPNQPPPPPPSYYSQGHTAAPPPPAAPIQSNFQILAQFNMTAHQRGYLVTYPARSEGPHHTPIWHVQCCLNGEVRGEGSGKNQKQAKEMAARQAWNSMGWGHLPDQ